MKSRRGIILNISIIGLFALTLFMPANPASAQSETWLAISPEESSVPLGNQVVLELMVTAGANINAFDLTLSYDPAIILLTAWESGDYLSSLAVVMENDTPGTFRLAATQLAQPEVSGDGVLLRLTFGTQAEGDTLVEIVEAVFADSQGGSMEPGLESGWVFVTLESTFTPTPTATVTLTPTPEPSKAMTPVPTLTPSATSVVVQETEPTPQLPDGEEEIGEDTPVSETEEGYPLEPDPEGQDITGNTQGDGYPPGDEDHDSEEGLSNAYTEPETQDDENSAEQQNNRLNFVLWGVVIICAVGFGLMIVIIVRRNKRKHEDLLL